ncbi:MAG: glycosyltransferase family 4 protein [Desulfonauticus sp.]|nr:glycosyltransferase family 4 protein [Desulfonauticus sp.]
MKTIWGTLDPFIEKGEILGRTVANANFLTTLLSKNPFSEYHFFLASNPLKTTLKQFIQENFPHLTDKIKIFPMFKLYQQLATTRYYCFHLSDCINYFVELTSLRNFIAKNIFPITGVTHSLSYKQFVYAYFSHLWSDWTQTETIIATSRVGKKVLKNFYHHLKSQYHLPSEFTPPQISHIPLGISDDYYQTQDKSYLRKKYNLSLKDVICIYVGRIAYDSKMDLIPVLRALGEVKKLTSQPITFIIAGYLNKNQKIASLLQNLAKNVNINLLIFPNIDDSTKIDLMQASDIFLSLVDNLQETFGISILEAKASKLAVIASEFNGYKELIDNNKDGFLIPTFFPAENKFLAEFSNFLFLNQIHLLTAQQTFFDFDSLVKTLLKLIEHKQLRTKVGELAFQNVQKFRWNNIINKYLNLWETLNYTAVNLNKKRPKLPQHPFNFDFFKIFYHYPTQTLDPKTKVKTSKIGESILQGKEFPVVYAFIENFIDLDKTHYILNHFLKTNTLESLISSSKGLISREKLIITTFWLLKNGYLTVIKT